ncbi:HmuY family protein [Olleya marilimosa]|uniref:HmuY family protein n=1 Tax=Olleya marilimosa TaxID=272164 RepID=A0ABR8LV04_9FLAO|nr:HmuY family protein [Olleya marilimosa]MBD3862944.1 HmuY family protein [Olleya marilimosa]
MKNKFLTLIVCLTALTFTNCSSDDDSTNPTITPTPASIGGIIDPTIGGFNQSNRVYFDLSTGEEVAVQRDTWELAIYNGAENRVYLNNSLLVSAAELSGITDITSVTETTELSAPMTLNTLDQTFSPTTVTVTTVEELIEGLPINYYQYGNLEEGISFTDSKEGELTGTAFGEISTTDSENNVYIINLGNDIPTENNGTLNTTGEARGYMKVRILSDGNTYTIQYAALSNTTDFSEITVTKDSSYNLTGVSLTNGLIIDTEPMSSNWDLDLGGVFSYYGSLGNLDAGLTYSDYTLHNTLSGVGLYQIDVEDDTIPTYTDFSFSDINEANLVFDNRAYIGSGWRSVDFSTGETTVTANRYYIIKDTDGNYYKLRFTAVESETGERGNPQFQYDLLVE